MNANAMLQQSAHRDVLTSPIPDTESSKRGLLEELKNRGRSAVGGKVWPDAQLLYEKALQITDVLPSTTDNECAILHSNLSLTLAKMGKFKEAKDAAEAATKKDGTYVKGWWRLGQALSSLKEFQAAVDAMEKAKTLDPNNKALTKEVDKLKVEAAKAPEEVAEDEGPKTEPAPPRSEIYTAKPSKPVAKKTTATATQNNISGGGGKTTSAGSSADVTMTDAVVDEEDKHLFTKSEPVRGYKIVNGKKTSYFHNELTDEARALIGDIAPKMIDASAASSTANNHQSGDNQNTSVWNQAGTWEEKNVTEWAKQSLTESLQIATFSFPDSSPAPGALARVETVKKVDGHASFATVRSKKKYIYEFHIDLEWVLDLPGEPDAAKGTISFPDMDGTCEIGEGYDITNYGVTSIQDHALRPVLDRFIKNSGLRDSLHQAMDDWVGQFRDKF